MKVKIRRKSPCAKEIRSAMAQWHIDTLVTILFLESHVTKALPVSMLVPTSDFLGAAICEAWLQG